MAEFPAHKIEVPSSQKKFRFFSIWRDFWPFSSGLNGIRSNQWVFNFMKYRLPETLHIDFFLCFPPYINSPKRTLPNALHDWVLSQPILLKSWGRYLHCILLPSHVQFEVKLYWKWAHWYTFFFFLFSYACVHRWGDGKLGRKKLKR